MMHFAEKSQVVELRLSAFGPVFDVVGVAELQTTAGEATASVPMGQGAAQGGRDDAGLAAQIEDSTLMIVSHDDLAGVASDAAGRFR